MNDELKKADETMKALRWLAKEPEFLFAKEQLNDAADLIDSLTAQLNEEISRRYQAECNYDHWKQQALESEHREKAAVCKEKTVNRGMSVSGEYDIECNLICPSCGAIVGDAESQELNGPYCNQCGQHLEIGPQEAEKGEAE